jgi:putative lipoic acid-binding regulatory protein
MARKTFDCREWPGECTLAISGEPQEVIEAQLLHVVHAHGQEDSPQLREQIRASLKDAPAGA